MKKNFVFLIISLLSFSLSGCIESVTLLKVDRKGKGTIAVKELFSPQITAMIQGMGGMIQDLEKEEKSDSGKSDSSIIKMFQENIEKKARAFGNDVKLLESHSITEKNGWKGYKAIYSFDNINKITIPLGDESETGATKKTHSEENSYVFSFTPGNPSVLRVKTRAVSSPLAGMQPPPIPATPEELPNEMEAIKETADKMTENMTQMMSKMFSGMRVSFIIKTDGPIRDTNALYMMETHPDVVVMLDMEMDKLINNYDAMKSLTSQNPDTMKKISDMDISGFKMQPADEEVVIKF